MTKRRAGVDAGNRTLRTLLQGVGFAILAAAVMVLYPIVSAAHGWGDLHWSLIGFSLVQAIGTAVLAYFMRTVLDPSGIPTPLPPSSAGEPADPVPPDERGAAAARLLAAVAATLTLIAAGLFLSSARADTGTMNYADYWAHVEGETQSNVEAHCGCTGHKWSDTMVGGEHFKVTMYTAGGGFTGLVDGQPITDIYMQYRFWGGGWHANTVQGRCSNDDHPASCTYDYY